MRTLALLSAPLALLTLALVTPACDVTTGGDETEDKDGINQVPGPSQSNGVGSGGLGGSNEGGGMQGMPCQDTVQCDDLNPCTTENCVNNVCQVSAAEDDGNLCTTDICDAMTGEITNTPLDVNDNNACTFDYCDPATGGANPSALPVFAEDFSDNLQGWVLGPQWQIGSASPSTGGLNGGNDPADDHSSSGDDGVAGTALGALVAATVGPSYMTSPPIDVSGVQLGAGEFAVLRFWRWLNTDVSPLMDTSVEVGTPTFSTVWSSGAQLIDSPPNGLGWFEVRIDITQAVATAQGAGVPLRVRFGFSKQDTPVSIGGFNIDDLSIDRVLVQYDTDICTIDSCTDMAGVPTYSSAPTPMCP